MHSLVLTTTPTTITILKLVRQRKKENQSRQRRVKMDQYGLMVSKAGKILSPLRMRGEEEGEKRIGLSKR